MSAEILRRAASLMRERAEVASAAGGSWDGCCASPQHANHVASWHPAVALAVAEMLTVMAEQIEAGNLNSELFICRAAIAVARAYLGAQE